MTLDTSLEFAVATTEEDRRAAYRLRYEELVARGWGDPAAYPEGLEYDEYDDDAVLIVARSAGKVVGTVRLIVEPRHVAGMLPDYGLQPGSLPADGTGIAGRFLIAPSFRRSREPVFGLLATLWRVCLDHGIRRGVTFQTENSIRWCRVHGIPLKVIGGAVEDRGEVRYAILVDDDVLSSFAAAATDAERSLLPCT